MPNAFPALGARACRKYAVVQVQGIAFCQQLFDNDDCQTQNTSSAARFPQTRMLFGELWQAISQGIVIGRAGRMNVFATGQTGWCVNRAGHDCDVFTMLWPPEQTGPARRAESALRCGRRAIPPQPGITLDLQVIGLARSRRNEVAACLAALLAVTINNCTQRSGNLVPHRKGNRPLY